MAGDMELRAKVDAREIAVRIKSLQSIPEAIIADVEEFAVEALTSAVSDVFEAEGPGWAPIERPGSILRDTGAMAGSFEAWKTGSGAVEGGFGVDYAIYHIEGTTRMPRRDPTELGQFGLEMESDIAEFAEERASRLIQR